MDRIILLELPWGTGISSAPGAWGSRDEVTAMNWMAPVALGGFWVLLGAGWLLGELHVRRTAVFLSLWLAGYAASRAMLPEALFTPYVAMLDIALVLLIFKGDIRLH
jgi:hypothetical protein